MRDLVNRRTAPEAAPDAAPDALATRVARAMRTGVVVIVLVWHFGYDVLIIVRGWSEYDPLWATVLAWSLVSVVLVVGSAPLVRAVSTVDANTCRVLAALAVGAGELAVVGYPRGQLLGDLTWAWNTVGWCGVMLLMHRPLWELAVMQAANTMVMVVSVAADGSLDRVAVGQLVVVSYATVGVQLVFAVVNQHLHVVAGRATELTLARAETRSRAAINDAVHAGRQRRYREIRDRVESLVRGLAEQTVDPADPEVRRVAGVEAARLRRLFAETDDTPTPLLHELRACSDLAERRGVDVTLLHVGDPPEVPASARRFLTEVALLVLVSTRTRARLTVVADDAGVVVSVVADAPTDVLDRLRDDLPVSIVHDPETNQLWVEVRWRTP